MTYLSAETIAPESERSLNERSFAQTQDDRRVFPRYPVPNKFAIELRVLPATNVIRAKIHDLSRDGIGLLTEVFIAPGESITFPIGGDWVVADVRHCHPSADGFVVGGAITDIVYENEPAN